MIEIKELNDQYLEQAKRLVFKVFPVMDVSERISFWIYKHQNKASGKLLMKLFGYATFLKYWVAIDEENAVCGIIGLYAHKKEEETTLWLSWFCVDPVHRGRGVGKQLIEFSIEEAKRCNKKYLCLYTSDDPNEANAQLLYEQYEFKITDKKKKDGYTIIYRKKELAG